ncbi:MAG: hypothetical protein WCW84_14270 [Sulfurimonas sp.]
MASKDPIRLVTSVDGKPIAKLEIPQEKAKEPEDPLADEKNKMKMDRQFDILTQVRGKLILHFGLPREDQESFFIAQDQDKTCWMLYCDWRCIFSFEEDEHLEVSFDLRVSPDTAASAMYCLLKNWFDVWVMECYFIDDEGEMFWGEEAESKYKTFCQNIK